MKTRHQVFKEKVLITITASREVLFKDGSIYKRINVFETSPDEIYNLIQSLINSTPEQLSLILNKQNNTIN